MFPPASAPASCAARRLSVVGLTLVFHAAALPAAEAPPPTLVPTTLLAAPEGLEVIVWAQAPQLRNPTNMDIDAEGQIWIAEGANYRRHAGRDPHGDRIIVSRVQIDVDETL